MLPTLESLRRGPRQSGRGAGSCCEPTSTFPLTPVARLPMTFASRPRSAHDSLVDRPRCRSCGVQPSWGAPTGSPIPRYTLAPVQVRLGDLAPGVELLENLRFDPRRDQQRRLAGSAIGRRLRRLCERRLWGIAPGPRLHRGTPWLSAQRRRAPVGQRGRGAARSEEQAQATVCRRAGRGQSERQARSDRRAVADLPMKW